MLQPKNLYIMWPWHDNLLQTLNYVFDTKHCLVDTYNECKCLLIFSLLVFIFCFMYHSTPNTTLWIYFRLSSFPNWCAYTSVHLISYLLVIQRLKYCWKAHLEDIIQGMKSNWSVFSSCCVILLSFLWCIGVVPFNFLLKFALSKMNLNIFIFQFSFIVTL